ncbi:hypothetical protein [Cellvibrio sp. OA-2007]|uniref:hypothetical protein n=1 Tax=Cellvibrio sp. OA-2007 TaxID=529823 RepID=UPI000783511E|nr:hypothetical protein [Cellvibrio sp. OA-2007]
MKKLSLIAALLMVVGCSETLESVTKTVVRDTVNQTLGTANTADTSASTADNGSYSQSNTGNQAAGTVKNEKIRVSQQTRTSRPYGKIIVAKTEENANGHTRVVFRGCSHPRIGANLACDLSLREVTEKNFLAQDYIPFWNTGDWKSIAAGRYYALASYDGSGDYYASADLSIKVGVTNYLDVALE